MCGKTLDVLIEGYMPEDGVYIGRSYKDAPDVDGFVFLKSPYELLTGQIVKVMITEANEYDLIGELEDEHCK
jgi:ribosomal protein S12 methylthiotransferase